MAKPDIILTQVTAVYAVLDMYGGKRAIRNSV